MLSNRVRVPAGAIIIMPSFLARWLLFSFLWCESPPRNLTMQCDFRSLAYLWVYLFGPRCLLFPVPMAYYSYIPRCSIFVRLPLTAVSWAIPE